tara:strand:+ start:2049 stop:3491 length:1443 start_codon:yes stop_codon:yes gene_type:complete
MIFNNYHQLKDIKFDLIIVGSGPAGISLALELEGQKISTLIIEAGKNNFSEESQKFYEGEIIGDNYPPLSVTRLRQFGGSSGHWGGLCRSLEEHDFSNWPIKKKDLDQFSDKAKKIINLRRNNFYTKKINENYDLVRFEVSPLRFRDKYRDKIKNSKNIHLITESYVTKILGNKKINKVIFFNKGQFFNLSSKYFVLACGGIENSKLMHLIRKNNPKLLDPNMPIGNYFFEHPYKKIGEAIIDIENFKNFLKKTKLHNSIKINCDGWFAVAPNKQFVNYHNILDSVMQINFVYTDLNIHKKSFVEKLKCIAPEYVRKILIKNNNKAMTLGITAQTSQKIDFNNKVELSKSKKDSLGIEQVNLFWKQSEMVRETYKKNIQELGKFFIDEDIGRVAAEEKIYSSETLDHDGGGHHMGGTRVGINSYDSVVDKNLKVHGVDNLFLAGSSVFASAGYSNPTFTIVQLSLRLGMHLKEKILYTKK